MTLLISAQDVLNMLTMPDVIEAMEQAFIEETVGEAVNLPRQRYTLPRQPALGEEAFWTNIIAGAISSRGYAALRIDSRIITEFEKDGLRRVEWRSPDRKSWGLVLLFDTSSGRPVAVFNDFTLSPIRVGATTGAAVRAVAIQDAREVGLFGSGNQAERNLEAITVVRDIDRVKVYSPNREHLDAFVERMSKRISSEIIPVEEPRAVVERVDIVMCATNSSVPVFDGEWLSAGQTIATIVNTDRTMRRTEVDRTTFLRSDLIVLNSMPLAIANEQVELLEPIEAGDLDGKRVKELGAILMDPSLGRNSDEDIVYYMSNGGVGIQFAAAGSIIYERCLEQGIGTEIPDDVLGASVDQWLDRGFNVPTS